MKSIIRSIFQILTTTTLCALCSARADTGMQAWVQRYNGPGNGLDDALAIAVDGSGDVIMTGYSTGNGGNWDYATIKYSSGGVPLWTNRYDGPGNGDDSANAIAVDSNRNVFVTGFSMGSGGNRDCVTIKYSSGGVPLWTNRYNGPGNSDDYGNAIAVDGGGNIIVTGESASNNTSPYNYDFVTIKYSGGGVPLWTNHYNGPGNGDDHALDMAVDGGSNVFVTGISVGSGGNYDYATIRYSSEGAPLWTNRYNGPGNDYDYPIAIAVDGSGDVVVTGYADFFAGADYTTIKYSGAGVPLWTNRYNGPGNDYDYAEGMVLDGSRNVFVTGMSMGSGGNYDYATIKYSSGGTPLWTNRYNGPANDYDYPTAIAVDGSGDVVVTGYADFFTGADYTTIKYSGGGVPLWTNRYNGPGNDYDYAEGMVADGNGNVFVTGYSMGSGGYDCVTIKYSGENISRIPIHIQRTNNQMLLTWTNAAFSLQSAPAVAGTFTNIPGAMSPYTNPITGPQQYFRLIAN
jgi:hypothetical protein